MPSLTVLSPHQDDAGLSLAMTIRAAARLGGRVRIVNCFTVSTFAPHSEARTAAEVGAIRGSEDREFAAKVGGAIEILDLGLEDAPIRLGCRVEQVRRMRVGRFERAEARTVAELVAKAADATVLAPLGLGRHIDHLIAREAGIRLAREGRSVVFYEDLPYAAELRECCVLRAADAVARRLGSRFRGAVVRDEEAAARKRFAIESYRSQLSRPQFDSVIRYGARMGGERIWGLSGLDAIPKLEPAGLQAGIFTSAWRRRFQCAAHAAANRTRAVCRRAAEWTVRGGIDAPQTN
jgi:LmbE family N-acetylglucosaminyl deacetylase